MTSGIYCITINEKIYIGSSCNLDIRRRVHLFQLKNNKHENIILQRSYNKNGLKNLSFEIVCYCKRENLLCFEQLCIDLFLPEYNICKKVGSPPSMTGRKHSEDTKKAMSLSHMGNKNCLGFKHSEKSKKSMSLSRIGNKYNLGHKASDEERAARAERMRGNTYSKGKKHPHTDESKANISLANLGKKRTEEQKALMSRSQQAYHANKKAEKALKALLEKPLEQPLEKPLEHKQQEVAA